MSKLLRWIAEFAPALRVVPLATGVAPLVLLRLGVIKRGRVRVRGFGSCILPDQPSSRVFTNIWIRHVYPRPGRGSVVLDLGANIGLFALFAAKAGAARVLCVEPCPESVEFLSRHIETHRLRSVIRVLPVAIGAKDGEAFIPVRNSVTNQVTDQPSTGRVRVPLADAKSLLDEIDPPVTYIKLDVEANEPAVLSRLAKSPRFRFVKAVAIEATSDLPALSRALEEAGFQVRTSAWPEPTLFATR